MFETLSERMKRVMDQVRGKGRLTEENVQDSVREIRRALLEADVALPVIKAFVDQVRVRALGSEVGRSLTPGQAFIKIIHDELATALGSGSGALDFRRQSPAVVVLAGLQGAGKTTTAAKLALLLTRQQHKRVGLLSTDTRRPAAILQLRQLAERAGVVCLNPDDGVDPEQIAASGLAAARRQQLDVVILDTAGRSRLDEALLDEVRRLHAQMQPTETLFVVDSMAGQDAVATAQAFGQAVPLTGIVLTKADGDTRGGAALSVRQVTGVPIKYIGTGEGIEALEAFHAERMASRILGMGDVVGLVEEVQRRVDHDKAARLARKVAKGAGFDLCDLRDQLEQIAGLGGVEGLLGKLPLPGNLSAQQLAAQVDPRAIRRQIAIIDSMTPAERRSPRIIDGSRRRRIAAGSGLTVQEVNRLLKQHLQMQKMMKKATRGGLAKALRGLPGGFR